MEYTPKFHMSNDRIDLHGHIGVQIEATDLILTVKKGIDENRAFDVTSSTKTAWRWKMENFVENIGLYL